MIKAVLVIWFGSGTGQLITMDHFDSLAECEAARAALIAEDWGDRLHVMTADALRCVPYSAPDPARG